MRYLAAVIVLFIVFVIYCIIENHRLQVTKTEITIPGTWTPRGDFLKVAVVSDLHNNRYGKDNKKLLHRIEQEKPDYILIPGDVTVNHSKRNPVAFDFLMRLSRLGIPVILSFGNHELKLRAYDMQLFYEYKMSLESYGIHVLDNAFFDTPDGLRIYGFSQPLANYKKLGKAEPVTITELKKALGEIGEHPAILLAHNPADFPVFAKWGAGLVISGHMHGGIVRIPGLGGVISPQWVFFPKYDAGMFLEKNSTLYVSRGLGTHTLPVRVFNRPELAILTLKTEEHDGNTGKA